MRCERWIPGRAAFDGDMTTVHLDRPSGDGQPEPGAATVPRSGFVEAEKPIEDPLAVLSGDAQPFVGDGRGVPRCHPRTRECGSVEARGLYLIALSTTFVIASRSTRRSAVTDNAFRQHRPYALIPLLCENPERRHDVTHELPQIDRARASRTVPASP